MNKNEEGHVRPPSQRVSITPRLIGDRLTECSSRVGHEKDGKNKLRVCKKCGHKFKLPATVKLLAKTPGCHGTRAFFYPYSLHSLGADLNE